MRPRRSSAANAAARRSLAPASIDAVIGTGGRPTRPYGDGTSGASALSLVDADLVGHAMPQCTLAATSRADRAERRPPFRIVAISSVWSAVRDRRVSGSRTATDRE